MTISEAGGIAESQVAVAPVEFGVGAAALQVADVLDTGEQAAAPPTAGGGAMAPMSVDALLAPEDVAVA